MILVDTSVWIEHIRVGNARLSSLLATCGVLQHPYVTGELALGNLRERNEMLEHLSELPQASVAAQDVVLELVESERLHGRGLGWVDVHLLASTLATGSRLWTNDRSLGRAATRLGIAA